jgi:hypothetical protein
VSAATLRVSKNPPGATDGVAGRRFDGRGDGVRPRATLQESFVSYRTTACPTDPTSIRNDPTINA